MDNLFSFVSEINKRKFKIAHSRELFESEIAKKFIFFRKKFGNFKLLLGTF